MTTPKPLADAFELFIAFKSGRSAHTISAYRNDFEQIAQRLSDTVKTPVAELAIDVLDKNSLRQAFSQYGEDHSKASKRRCWSTWNGLCEFLVDEEMLDRNPMRHVSKASSKAAQKPPVAMDDEAASRLIAFLSRPGGPTLSDWPERDLALVSCGLLLGMRMQEMIDLNIGDLQPMGDGSGDVTVKVHGKNNKYRTVVARPEFMAVIERYLESRKARRADTRAFGKESDRVPLFVSSTGERITRGTVQYRISRAYAHAGILRTPGASSHRLRHTFAIRLAEQNVPLHELMSLLGHSNLSSTQPYLNASGVATRKSAAKNPIYKLMDKEQDT